MKKLRKPKAIFIYCKGTRIPLDPRNVDLEEGLRVLNHMKKCVAWLRQEEKKR